MIYERQIKRFILFIDSKFLIDPNNRNIDLFVISASDSSVLLDYASISNLNKTLDNISNP
jgi:hypothetical protein